MFPHWRANFIHGGFINIEPSILQKLIIETSGKCSSCQLANSIEGFEKMPHQYVTLPTMYQIYCVEAELIRLCNENILVVALSGEMIFTKFFCGFVQWSAIGLEGQFSLLNALSKN